MDEPLYGNHDEPEQGDGVGCLIVIGALIGMTAMVWLMRALRMVCCALVVVSAGCALPMRRTCIDGWAIKILQDTHCLSGICGYTCEPDRLRLTTKVEGSDNGT